jgi:2-polyprenyl-6-methoxyphenol hydroxylase-like FAD-dependent oxidoreductase
VDAEVLVVGSGPVGLTLACELMRRGTTVRIIERTTARERQSKGIAVTPRTLEIFDSLGVPDRLLARGHRLAGNDIYARGRRIASIGYGRIGPTRYPFALAIPQWEVEDALSDALVRLGGTVETDTTLREINQERTGSRPHSIRPRDRPSIRGSDGWWDATAA